MAEFTIYALDHQRKLHKLYYDNITSELFTATGQAILPHKAGPEYIRPQQISATQPGIKRDINRLKISFGLSCNYSCHYCSQRLVARQTDMGINDVQPFVDRLSTWFNIAGTDGQGGGNKIEFWGGEPLVYIKAIKLMAEQLRQMMPKAEFMMITNGSLLNLEINAWLDDMGFAIGLSYDGPGQFVRGPDPMANPEQRAAILDLYHRLHPKGRISINAMLNKHNTSRLAIQQRLRELFSDDVIIYEGTFVDPYNAEGLADMLAPEQHLAFRWQALQEIRSGNLTSFRIVYDRMSDFADSLLTRRDAKYVGQKCGMDKPQTLATTLKGEVITCQNVSPVETAPNGNSHHIGTVNALDQVKLNTATHWQHRPDCQNCPVLQLCKGACMFLEGKLWESACATSYSDNLPFFAATIEYLTKLIPIRIDGPIPDDRKQLWPANSFAV